jgi:aspartyl/asparaginyl beta-hydroxylase (cupin superfamily)
MAEGFLESRKFAFVDALEAHWIEIRQECLSLPSDSFEPWVQREMYGEGWSVYGLIAFGERIEDALRDCPKTASLLGRVPGLTTAGFSRLAPGAHIRPHVGWVRTVYRLHMGIVVPPNCALRVGAETRPWREGACLVFDDTVEHEAWNRSGDSRIVLLLDFLRPGVDASNIDVTPPEVEAMIRRRMGASRTLALPHPPLQTDGHDGRCAPSRARR